MKPSLALRLHREEIQRIVAANRGLNPRVFGSVLHEEDTDDSDLDLLIDAADSLSLLDMARMALAIGKLVQTTVDVRTPEDLSMTFRKQVFSKHGLYDRKEKAADIRLDTTYHRGYR